MIVLGLLKPGRSSLERLNSPSIIALEVKMSMDCVELKTPATREFEVCKWVLFANKYCRIT